MPPAGPIGGWRAYSRALRLHERELADLAVQGLGLIWSTCAVRFLFQFRALSTRRM
jgi:hypothetical protein